MLAFVLTAWWTTKIGPLALSVLTIIVLGYFLFRAPVWCAAQNRDGTSCRRNASGLLFGCSYRQHKWQKAKMMFLGRRWDAIKAALFGTPATALASVGAIIALLNEGVALVHGIAT